MKKPLLFQVSKGGAPQGRGAEGAPKAISSPALGRIAPVHLGDAKAEAQGPQAWRQEDGGAGLADEPRPAAAEAEKPEGQSIFWRLALMELHEAAFLLAVNGLIAFVACRQLHSPFLVVYSGFWPQLLAMHALVSWAYLLLPMLLTGSTPSMLRHGFGIADTQMEKRFSFSLFMLLSVAFLPLSFLCMVLTPAHATLAELLTGQEIRERAPGLTRRR